MKKILVLIIIAISIPLYGQTLDQQLRRAESTGIISSELMQSLSEQRTSQYNSSQFYKTAPSGIASLFMPPELIESTRMGNLAVYYPKGYGDNKLHYGIWNAIPFVVFDHDLLEVRFGLIFEHRQMGFVPDEWVGTSITGENLPEMSFLIPDSKSFLNFNHGSSQWRSTVLLTEDQVRTLSMYANSTSSEAFTVSHRFSDGKTRPYLIGDRNKQLFRTMIGVYIDISNVPEIKKYRSSDSFPAGAFFDELDTEDTVEEVDEYGYDDEYGDDYGYDDDYADEYGDEYGYDDEYGDEYGYDDDYGYYDE